MLFNHEELQEEFHQLETMTQVICGVFENECFSCGLLTMVMDIKEDVVLLQIPDSTIDWATHLCMKLCAQFVRKDQDATCICCSDDFDSFRILRATAEDLTSLH